MIVRAAQRSDLVEIGRVAEAAHWASYEALLRPDTIGRLLTRDFGPSQLARRLLRGQMSVITSLEEVIAFADGAGADDSIHVAAIAVAPQARRRGAGTALLRALQQIRPDLPISADVFLGNIEGEGFYEANGFVPGEIVSGRLFDEEVVERRWWKEAVSRPQEERVSSG